MYVLAVPLLLAYAGYSLVYETHRFWYSFVISTLVGSVYAYGVLMLVPSIYINYRLKSAAHMSGKAMVYKFLNTFIDDFVCVCDKNAMDTPARNFARRRYIYYLSNLAVQSGLQQSQ